MRALRVAACALIIAVALPQTADGQALASGEAGALDSVATAELRAWRAPGMALAVVRGDSVVFRRAYGLANVETGQPMTPDLVVSVASVSKTVTSVAAVKLSLEGKLDLGVPIRRYLSYLPEGLGAVTLEQLLSHTAGLGERTPWISPSLTGALAPVCQAMTDSALVTEPGRTWGYSNTAYVLAGCVIEAALEAPFPRVMAESLFGPLGMDRTSFNPLYAMTFPHAQGHDTRRDAPTVVRPFNSYPPIAPAGELVTTVDDLARLARALLADGRLDGARVLPPGILARLSEPYGYGGPLLGGARDYGLGTFIREHRGVRVLEHEGVLSGFGASLALAPDRGVAAVAVTNGRYSFPARSTQAAIEVAAGLTPSPTGGVRVALSPVDSAAAIGVYASTGDPVEILSVEGRLVLRRGDRTYPIVARQEGHWELPEYPALLPIPATPLEIVRTGAGGAVSFIRLAWRLYPRVE